MSDFWAFGTGRKPSKQYMYYVYMTYVRNFLKSNHFYDTNLHTAHHIACWNRDLGDHLDMYGVQITVLHTLLLWTSFLFLVSENEKTEIFSGKFVSTRTTCMYVPPVTTKIGSDLSASRVYPLYHLRNTCT